MDYLFFFKDSPPASLHDLPWPGPVQLVAIDPPPELMCGGVDPRCSAAYTRLADSLRDPSGRILPNFLRRYASGDVGRIAFVGFSAAHGFFEPLAENAEDRDQISAYLLLDATFGGGKVGYQAFLRDAAAGKKLLVTTTGDTGGTDGWKMVVASAGVPVESIAPDPRMPVPSQGARRMGLNGYWYEYGAELRHWQMAAARRPVIESYLIPWWSGASTIQAAPARRGSGAAPVIGAFAGAAIGGVRGGIGGALAGGLIGGLAGAILGR